MRCCDAAAIHLADVGEFFFQPFTGQPNTPFQQIFIETLYMKAQLKREIAELRKLKNEIKEK